MKREVTGFIPTQKHWYRNISGRSVEKVRWSPSASKKIRELDSLKSMKLVSRKRVRRSSPTKDGKSRRRRKIKK